VGFDIATNDGAGMGQKSRKDAKAQRKGAAWDSQKNTELEQKATKMRTESRFMFLAVRICVNLRFA
jgi:hypothetical protein